MRKLKFFLITDSDGYRGRIFLLRDTGEDDFATANYLDFVETMGKLSFWGNADKVSKESFGVCDGWEFPRDKLDNVVLWLKGLGFKQVEKLEDLGK